MTMLDLIHDRRVAKRRVRRLTTCLSQLVPDHTTVLDVGTGDGRLARAIMQEQPQTEIVGVDIAQRSGAAIPVTTFDGQHLPFPNNSFDVVMFVDVLHHTDDPMILLRESVRVSRGMILIKDHLADGIFAEPILRFMDRAGNARHGVPLPYNYWCRNKWHSAFEALGLKRLHWTERLSLYDWPASLVFDRTLHFVGLLGHS